MVLLGLFGSLSCFSRVLANPSFFGGELLRFCHELICCAFSGVLSRFGFETFSTNIIWVFGMICVVVFFLQISRNCSGSVELGLMGGGPGFASFQVIVKSLTMIGLHHLLFVLVQQIGGGLALVVILLAKRWYITRT